MNIPKRPALRRWQRITLLWAALLVFYVGSYALNSALGGYWLKPERDGAQRWSFGLSIHSAILWQPAYGYCALYNSDWLGAFYLPLVTLDRRWVHPTMSVLDDSAFQWYKHKARASDIHPRWRAEFIKSRSL